MLSERASLGKGHGPRLLILILYFFYDQSLSSQGSAGTFFPTGNCPYRPKT